MLALALQSAIILDHAHLASPVAVAWTNRKFRARMYRHPGQFIFLPLLIMASGVICGLHLSRHDRAFELLLISYLVWNAYHFGMQNYGLLALKGWRRLGRLSFFATIIAITVPAGVASSIALPAISFLHWITDIGLSSLSVARRWWLFAGAMLLLGCAGFLFKTVDCRAVECQVAMYSLPILIATRISLGFVHFLYSRWVWRRESPVIAALGWSNLNRKSA